MVTGAIISGIAIQVFGIAGVSSFNSGFNLEFFDSWESLCWSEKSGAEIYVIDKPLDSSLTSGSRVFVSK